MSEGTCIHARNLKARVSPTVSRDNRLFNTRKSHDHLWYLTFAIMSFVILLQTMAIGRFRQYAIERLSLTFPSVIVYDNGFHIVAFLRGWNGVDQSSKLHATRDFLPGPSRNFPLDIH